MNKKWERKPCKEFKEHRDEDLFKCHTCNNWIPWFYYTDGKKLAVGGDDGNDTYKFMNDDDDRGGRQWSCNNCIDKFLHKNKLITIRNAEGKLIDF